MNNHKDDEFYFSDDEIAKIEDNQKPLVYVPRTFVKKDPIMDVTCNTLKNEKPITLEMLEKLINDLPPPAPNGVLKIDPRKVDKYKDTIIKEIGEYSWVFKVIQERMPDGIDFVLVNNGYVEHVLFSDGGGLSLQPGVISWPDGLIEKKMAGLTLHGLLCFLREKGKNGEGTHMPR